MARRTRSRTDVFHLSKFRSGPETAHKQCGGPETVHKSLGGPETVHKSFEGPETAQKLLGDLRRHAKP